MKADSSEVDAAIIAVLQNDPELRGYCPDGVFFDEAFPGAQRFVIVSLFDEVDELTFDAGRAIEDALYYVKAVMLAVESTDIKAAAARIDQLLDDVLLAAPNYGEIAVVRERRQRMRETDDANTSIRWDHRGGYYRVMATPIADTSRTLTGR
jgi:hypothetical protein